MTHNTEGERCDYTASFPAEPFVEDRAAMVRNAALEEAVQACEELMKDHDDSFGMIVAPDACAAAIRALKTP